MIRFQILMFKVIMALRLSVSGCIIKFQILNHSTGFYETSYDGWFEASAAMYP
jgi:hypothetical protein